AANRYLGRVAAYDESIARQRGNGRLEPELDQAAGAGFNLSCRTPGLGCGEAARFLGSACRGRSVVRQYEHAGHYFRGAMMQADPGSLRQRTACARQQI